MPSWPLDATSSHLAYLKRTNGLLVLCAHIFEFFQACLAISEHAVRYGVVREMAILVDAKSKTHIESSLDEVVLAVLRSNRDAGLG